MTADAEESTGTERMDDQPSTHAADMTSAEDVATPVVLPHETIWRRTANRFWGYDYFISYHWASGGAYAVALAQRLRDRNYDVFLDRSEYAMGDDWKRVGERALRNTQRLVLVATRAAVTASLPVEREVRLFTGRGKQVVPIVFVGDPMGIGRHSIDGLDRTQHHTLALIADSQIYIEDDHANLAHGPSDAVLQQLTDTYRLTRRRNVRALAMGLVAAILIAFSTFSTISWARAYLEQRAAESSRDGERRARIEETKERLKAEERARVATSRQLAALSASERGTRLDRALLLAVEAVRVKDTFEGRDSLYRALHERPGLTSLLHLTEGGVGSVAFSPDGKTLATGYKRGVVLWDVAGRRRLMEAPLDVKEGDVTSLAFSADGKALAAGYGGGPGGVVLWDMASRRRVAEVPLRVNKDGVLSVAFSPDGKTLAAGYAETNNNEGGVLLWDVASRARVAEAMLAVKEGGVRSVAFSPDGRTLAAGYTGHGGIDIPPSGLVLWDVAKRRRVAEAPLAVMEGFVWSVAYSADGKTLAGGYYAEEGGGVVLWEVAGLRRLPKAPLAVAEGGVPSIAFSPDGKTLVAGYDNRYTVGGARGVVVWSVPGWFRRLEAPLAVREGNVTGVAFSPDGKVLAAGCEEETGGGVVLWTTTYQRRVAEEPLGVREGHVTSLAFSPDGQALAAGYGNLGVGSSGGTLLWDVAGQRRLAEAPLAVKEGGVTSVAFSPDGRILATGYHVGNGYTRDGGGVVLWDVAGRRRLTENPLAVKEGPVGRVAFSPDGQALAAAYGNRDANGRVGTGAIVVWNVADRRRLEQAPLAVSEGEIWTVAFSPDGKVLAAGYVGHDGREGGVLLWDVARRRRLPRPPLPVTEGGVSSMAFSPDGKMLAAGYGYGYRDTSGGGVVLWDAATLHRLANPSLAVDEGRVLSVRFTTDGKPLAAADAGGRAVLWDVANRDRLAEAPIGVKQGTIAYMAIRTDGKALAVNGIGGDETVVLWDVDLESWQRLAAQIANRNFSRKEWRQLFPEKPYGATFPDLPIPPDISQNMTRSR